MGELPPARPPLPSKAEKPSEVAQTEVPVTETSQETSQTEVAEVSGAERKQQDEARLAQLRAEIMGDNPPSQQERVLEVVKPTEAVEKTAEQAEAEQLKVQLQIHQTNIEEMGRQMEATEDKIEAIKKEKGYEVKGRLGTPEDILAALLPNKRTGLENLNKIMAALPEGDSDRERLKTVIRTIERLSDDEVKNMALEQSYSWVGISGASLRYDRVDYEDLPKITSSENVGMAVNEFKRGQKKIQEVREKIDNDPDIVANKTQKETLRKQYYSEVNLANDLENRIKSLENVET